MSVCVCLCLSLCVPVFVSVYDCVSVSIVSLCVCLCVSMYVCVSVSVFLCLSVWLCLCVCTSLSVFVCVWERGVEEGMFVSTERHWFKDKSIFLNLHLNLVTRLNKVSKNCPSCWSGWTKFTSAVFHWKAMYAPCPLVSIEFLTNVSLGSQSLGRDPASSSRTSFQSYPIKGLYVPGRWPMLRSWLRHSLTLPISPSCPQPCQESSSLSSSCLGLTSPLYSVHWVLL